MVAGTREGFVLLGHPSENLAHLSTFKQDGTQTCSAEQANDCSAGAFEAGFNGGHCVVLSIGSDYYQTYSDA